jgi:hypothetical protein
MTNDDEESRMIVPSECPTETRSGWRVVFLCPDRIETISQIIETEDSQRARRVAKVKGELCNVRYAKLIEPVTI